jgi:hypothetical protein
MSFPDEALKPLRRDIRVDREARNRHIPRVLSSLREFQSGAGRFVFGANA